MPKSFSAATNALLASWNSFLNASDKLFTNSSFVTTVTILKRGSNCVFEWKEFVVKIPDSNDLLFQREVRAIEKAPFATEFGFVSASVVNVSPELRRSIPRKLRATTTAILMPRLSGCTAIDADLTQINPDIIISTLIDSHSKLLARGWCNTDCKLDNIQLLSSGIKLLDWGSLCPINATDPTFTFYVHEYESSPLVCMSINLIVTILELCSVVPPKNTRVSVDTYKRLRQHALECVNEPFKTRLDNLLMKGIK